MIFQTIRWGITSFSGINIVYNLNEKVHTMKLISWNIDSLNAALTSDSARAKLSQDVLQTLVAEDADIIAIQETKLSAKGPTKKHLEVLEELFPGYENTWRSSQEPARKGYAGTMFLYKKELTPTISFPENRCPFYYGLGRTHHYPRI